MPGLAASLLVNAGTRGVISLSRCIKGVSLCSLKKCREFQVGRVFLALKEVSGCEGDEAELMGRFGPGQELSEAIFS